MSSQLPARVIVSPELAPLRPDLDWDDRTMVIGHVVKPESGRYLFAESGSDHIYYRDTGALRFWLWKNGYQKEAYTGELCPPADPDGVYVRSER